MKYLGNTKNIFNRYSVNNGCIYYVGQDYNFYKNGVDVLQGKYSIRCIYRDYIFLFDDNSLTTILYNTNNMTYERFEYAFSIITEIDKKVFVRIRKNGQFFCALYNFCEKSIEKVYPSNYNIDTIVSIDKFLTKEENIISCNFLEKGCPIWQKEFSEKIEGDILPYEDKLLVSLNNGEFICLEQSTGKEVWRCEGVYGYRKIIEDKFSFQLAGNSFTIVDLEKGLKISDVNLEELNNTNKVFPAGAGIVKNKGKIYFTSSGFGSQPSIVGSFNIETCEYDWLHFFENMKKKGFPSGSLQYHEDKLYVLDMDGVLHIFEEE
jgi:outer membrane protein assembly factor BamB